MFELELTASAVEDLRHFKKFERNIILDGIETHLAAEPSTETRRKKELRMNELTEWELRIGKYRVFYDVDVKHEIVTIKAIGWKTHNILLIRGKEYEL